MKKKFIKLLAWITVFFFIGRLTAPTIQTIRIVEVPVEIEKEIPEPSPVLKSEQDLLKEEIKFVFGEHYADAMKLLTDPVCHENLPLDPKAIHKNNDSVKSRDLGLFQINDHWQGFDHQGKADQFLLDPHINIRIAWRLYEDAGYSFNAWSCGKVLGI